MALHNFFRSYQRKTASLLEKETKEVAMSQAVGGEFEAVGSLEFALLRQEGLQPGHVIIDAGCGSGRLAVKLREFQDLTFIGLDVVPDLLRHAESLCNRPDWRFYMAPGTSIPEPDGSADFVTFFSVFTHLLHEETFRYMNDATRVLKPGGKLIFSFLEYAIPSHWWVFDNSVLDTDPNKVLNQFIDRDMIRGFAARVGLDVKSIHDGDKPHIAIDSPVVWEDGRIQTGMGNLGQSVCVMLKGA